MDHSERLPREPEAFTEIVARLLARLIGRVSIDIVGPLELKLDDQRIDLHDVYRAAQREEVAAAALIERFAAALITARQLAETSVPFEMIAARVLPQIRPQSFFEGHRPDAFAAQPYVNDTAVLYTIDLGDATTPITTEQLIRWGVDLDTLDALARRNLARDKGELEGRLYHADQGAAAVFSTGDGYDASRLLLAQLHPALAPALGGDFLVAIPSRDVLMAFPARPTELVDRLHERVAHDFRRLPFPITDGLFLVTLDGVADWRGAA